jgi:hypothetical protein
MADFGSGADPNGARDLVVAELSAPPIKFPTAFTVLGAVLIGDTPAPLRGEASTTVALDTARIT